MKQFETIKAQYMSQGVKEDNILYAIDAVKEGTQREHVLENLTADYRGMDYIEATQMLEELFAANGGEFKKENRYGYLYGVFFLLMGFAAAFYIFLCTRMAVYCTGPYWYGRLPSSAYWAVSVTSLNRCPANSAKPMNPLKIKPLYDAHPPKSYTVKNLAR